MSGEALRLARAWQGRVPDAACGQLLWLLAWEAPAGAVALRAATRWIARELGMDQSSAVRALARLEAVGALRRRGAAGSRGAEVELLDVPVSDASTHRCEPVDTRPQRERCDAPAHRSGARLAPAEGETDAWAHRYRCVDASDSRQEESLSMTAREAAPVDKPEVPPPDRPRDWAETAARVVSGAAVLRECGFGDLVPLKPPAPSLTHERHPIQVELEAVSDGLRVLSASVASTKSLVFNGLGGYKRTNGAGNR